MLREKLKNMKYGEKIVIEYESGKFRLEVMRLSDSFLITSIFGSYESPYPEFYKQPGRIVKYADEFVEVHGNWIVK